MSVLCVDEAAGPGLLVETPETSTGRAQLPNPELVARIKHLFLVPCFLCFACTAVLRAASQNLQAGGVGLGLSPEDQKQGQGHFLPGGAEGRAHGQDGC